MIGVFPGQDREWDKNAGAQPPLRAGRSNALPFNKFAYVFSGIRSGGRILQSFLGKEAAQTPIAATSWSAQRSDSKSGRYFWDVGYLGGEVSSTGRPAW
jgi:hypothetical protein